MAQKILIVDDDPNVLRLMDYTFREEGYDVASAANGVRALEVLEEHVPDLIIADVMMPVMDGYELCRRIRSRARLRTIPFIFLSARGTTEDRLAGLEVGADDYLVKPFDRRELIAKARTLLNRVRIYREFPVGQDSEQPEDVSDLLPFPVPGMSDGASEESCDPKILVVDDDDAMVRLLELFLRKTDCSVHTAHSGAEALLIGREIVPDLVVSDVMMPEMSGEELRLAYEQDSELEMIPFLFLTGEVSTEQLITLVRKDMDDSLTKPVNPQLFATKVDALLERKRSREGGMRKQIEDAARRMSSHLEPNVPNLKGMSIAQDVRPLEVRGGDYCDYVTLDDGRIAIIVGDVMGKKWGAWFFSVAYIAYLRSVIRSVSATEQAPSSIVAHINQLLWKDLKVSEVFTTLFLGIIDPRQRTVTFTSAGHPPPFQYLAHNGTAVRTEQPGLILGVQPDYQYEELRIELSRGDALVMYSDGITEAMNPDGELFGEDRLRQAVETCATGDARALVSGIFAAVSRHCSGTLPQDDRTVVVLQVDS